MLAGGLLGDGGLGGLGADGDAGVGLAGLGDAGLGDSDAQGGGGGDVAVVGGTQSGRGSLGGSREALGDGSGGSFGLHDVVLSFCGCCKAHAIDIGLFFPRLLQTRSKPITMRSPGNGRKKYANAIGQKVIWFWAYGNEEWKSNNEVYGD